MILFYYYLLFIFSVAVYVCVKRKKGDLSVKMTYVEEQAPYSLSGLERAGVSNPLAGTDYDEVAHEKPENPLYGDKVALVNNM